MLLLSGISPIFVFASTQMEDQHSIPKITLVISKSLTLVTKEALNHLPPMYSAILIPHDRSIDSNTCRLS